MPGRITPEEIADRLEIGDLLGRYTLAIDRGRWSELETVFLPDAVIDYTSAGGVKGGLPEVTAWLTQVLEAFPGRQHVVGHMVVRWPEHGGGERAEVSAYFTDTLATTTEMTTPAGAGPILGGGLYHHTLVRTPDGWRSQALVEEQLWRVCL